MKRKTLVTILQLVIFVGLGIFIIFYMAGQMSAKDKQEMMASIKSTRLWLLVPVLIAGFLSHLFRALRWKLLLEPLEIYPTTANTTCSVLVGYLANLFIPRAGEVAKCTVLASYEKVPADKMVGTIVAERAFDVLCLLAVIGLTIGLQAEVIGDFARTKFGILAAKGPQLLLALGAVALLVVLMTFFYRRNKQSRVGRFIKGMGDGVRAILRMKKRGLFLLYTFLIWAMYLLQVQIGFWSMPATEHLGPLAALVVLVFGSIGMIGTQGGIGLYTFLIAEILVFYQLSPGDGQAFGWVSWSAQTAIVLILGIAALILLPLYNRTKHNAQAPVDSQ